MRFEKARWHAEDTGDKGGNSIDSGWFWSWFSGHYSERHSIGNLQYGWAEFQSNLVVCIDPLQMSSRASFQANIGAVFQVKKSPWISAAMQCPSAAWPPPRSAALPYPAAAAWSPSASPSTRTSTSQRRAAGWRFYCIKFPLVNPLDQRQ